MAASDYVSDLNKPLATEGGVHRWKADWPLLGGRCENRMVVQVIGQGLERPCLVVGGSSFTKKGWALLGGLPVNCGPSAFAN